MSRDWSDLRVRLLSAVVMVLVAGWCLWAGGLWFLVLAYAAGLAMLWELAGMIRGPRVTSVFMAWGSAVVIAVLSLSILRLQTGVTPVLFVILVVAVTDICGYFAGRMIGGRLFWPAVSPKKTWSGVIAGWVGAGVLAIVMGQPILLAVLLSMVSQAGDFSESALKRRCGVKDASNLIPGHGGVLDRLDGLIAASIVAGVLGLLRIWPGVAG